MKIKESFLIHESGEETLLVPTGNAPFSGIVRGNNTLGAILKQLQKGTTEDELVSAVCAEYEAEREIVERDVKKVLTTLREIGALDE